MSTGGADKSGSGGGGAGGPVKTPSDFLKSIRGRPVVVKLNSGVDYRGKTVKVRVWNVQQKLFNCCRCASLDDPLSNPSRLERFKAPVISVILEYFTEWLYCYGECLASKFKGSIELSASGGICANVCSGEVGVTIDQEHRPSRSSLDVIGRRREGAAVSAEQQGHSAGKTWEQAAAVG
ncbi:hypothetical protein TRIUR3_30962 [Triticum urartu]|uniref:Uncharacterized protein n=1 Tax=Triticum urartu TaxID=4572 RepID=M7ZAZ3_TRIUA|nr:hypothetical protein TRIUR3_30962 [Triticum urartu]